MGKEEIIELVIRFLASVLIYIWFNRVLDKKIKNAGGLNNIEEGVFMENPTLNKVFGLSTAFFMTDNERKLVYLYSRYFGKENTQPGNKTPGLIAFLKKTYFVLPLILQWMYVFTILTFIIFGDSEMFINYGLYILYIPFALGIIAWILLRSGSVSFSNNENPVQPGIDLNSFKLIVFALPFLLVYTVDFRAVYSCFAFLFKGNSSRVNSI